MLKCSHQIIPTPTSFHRPLLSLYPPFHTVSIPMCKGHPGNREAAVDREINKQKKRERSDGGQSLVIHRVNCRPTSHKHTPKAPGLGGVRPLLSNREHLCMYVSITCFLCFVIVLALHLPSSLCLCSLLPLCSLLVLCLSSCFPLPRLFLTTESAQAVGVVETFFGQRRHFLFSRVLFFFFSVCFYLRRT